MLCWTCSWCTKKEGLGCVRCEGLKGEQHIRDKEESQYQGKCPSNKMNLRSIIASELLWLIDQVLLLLSNHYISLDKSFGLRLT